MCGFWRKKLCILKSCISYNSMFHYCQNIYRYSSKLLSYFKRTISNSNKNEIRGSLIPKASTLSRTNTHHPTFFTVSRHCVSCKKNSEHMTHKLLHTWNLHICVVYFEITTTTTPNSNSALQFVARLKWKQGPSQASRWLKKYA